MKNGKEGKIMVKVIQNPGAEKSFGSIELAENNIKKFIEDSGIYFEYEYSGQRLNGRFVFNLIHKNISYEIGMVGENIESVRYIDGYTQNIWDYPRLYVNGNSYVWLYALKNVTGETEKELLFRLGVNYDRVCKFQKVLQIAKECGACPKSKMSFNEIKKKVVADEQALYNYCVSEFPCESNKCEMDLYLLK